jgi:aminoglycoside phosphotransferase (APT) family kinase protein
METQGLARHGDDAPVHHQAPGPDPGSRESGWPDVAPGPILTSGRDVDVYALDEERVLRRNRSGHSAAREALIVRHITAYGFPAPLVYRAEGPDLEMERLHGPTLLQSLAAQVIRVRDAARILADLHTQLHAIPALELPGLPTRPGDVVVHMDLHPANIVLTEAHGPSVVDWVSARSGTAALDVAMTALLLAEVAADAGGEYSEAARVLLVAFLAHVGVDPRPALDQACRFRTGDPGLVPGERDLVPIAADLVRRLATATAAQR